MPLAPANAGANQASSNARTSPAPHSMALPRGATLYSGTYVLEDILGQGGFGITYAALDTRLRRAVAIKEYFPAGNALRIEQDNRLEPTGGLSRAAFEAARAQHLGEAQTLAGFNHAGIVKIFNFFEEHNTAYQVMELLRGKPLMKRIEESGVVPEVEAVSLIEKVGSALAAVHEAGMLHRDIKPDNIMLCLDGRVVLCDFGTARAFTGQTTRMDALLTPGYAPLEQYSSQARFGPYTDLYALGATLYHCLTGQVPIDATDRSQGIKLEAPHKLRAGVSRTLSEAVMWALEIKVGDRPADVNQWLLALRSTKTSPRSSGSSNSSRSTPVNAPPQRNPREGRLRALVQEMKISVAPPASAHDARLSQIAARLQSVPGFATTEKECPSCHAATLVRVAPQATRLGACPLCNTSRLQVRVLDEKRCPVCREDKLREKVLTANQLICPCCKIAPLRDDVRRKALGLVADLWLVCPSCAAEWDVLMGGKAKMMVAGSSGAGREWMGQTLSINQWRAHSGRAQQVLVCDGCTAQWDAPNDQEVKLVHATRDPFGVVAKLRGHTFFRQAWSKLAHGLPLGAGNTFCSGCNADFLWDERTQMLKLLRGGEGIAWVAPLVGRAMPLSSWILARIGKRSGRAGWMCSTCRSEWDDEHNGWKGVALRAPILQAQSGKVLSRDDWHRLSRHLPLSSEEALLRNEQKKLQTLQGNEQAGWHRHREQQVKTLQSELEQLVRESWREGYFPCDAIHPALRADETLLWHSSSQMLKQRSREGFTYWDADKSGRLLVTSNRIVLQESLSSEAWWRARQKLSEATIEYSNGRHLLVLRFAGLKKPIAFAAEEMTLNAKVEGAAQRVTLHLQDLAELLKQNS
jgi:serine/threonine protein kinase